jgi:hypothetical protein
LIWSCRRICVRTTEPWLALGDAAAALARAYKRIEKVEGRKAEGAEESPVQTLDSRAAPPSPCAIEFLCDSAAQRQQRQSRWAGLAFRCTFSSECKYCNARRRPLSLSELAVTNRCACVTWLNCFQLPKRTLFS